MNCLLEFESTELPSFIACWPARENTVLCCGWVLASFHSRAQKQEETEGLVNEVEVYTCTCFP